MDEGGVDIAKVYLAFIFTESNRAQPGDSMKRGRPLSRREPIYFDQVAFDIALVRTGICSVRRLASVCALSEGTISLVRNGWIPGFAIQTTIATALDVAEGELWKKVPLVKQKAAG